jgi:hypothetical protein
MLWNNLKTRWSEMMGRAREVWNGPEVAEPLDARAALVSVLRSRGDGVYIDAEVAMSRWHDAFGSMPRQAQTPEIVLGSPTPGALRSSDGTLSPPSLTPEAVGRGSEGVPVRRRANQTQANARKARLQAADRRREHATDSERPRLHAASSMGDEPSEKG